MEPIIASKNCIICFKKYEKNVREPITVHVECDSIICMECFCYLYLHWPDNHTDRLLKCITCRLYFGLYKVLAANIKKIRKFYNNNPLQVYYTITEDNNGPGEYHFRYHGMLLEYTSTTIGNFIGGITKMSTDLNLLGFISLIIFNTILTFDEELTKEKMLLFINNYTAGCKRLKNIYVKQLNMILDMVM